MSTRESKTLEQVRQILLHNLKESLQRELQRQEEIVIRLHGQDSPYLRALWSGYETAKLRIQSLEQAILGWETDLYTATRTPLKTGLQSPQQTRANAKARREQRQSKRGDSA